MGTDLSPCRGKPLSPSHPCHEDSGFCSFSEGEAHTLHSAAGALDYFSILSIKVSIKSISVVSRRNEVLCLLISSLSSVHNT